MNARIMDRDRHADGLQVPAVFATGLCYHGHDITEAANIQIHDRTRERGGYAIRCAQCKRNTADRQLAAVAPTIPPKTCVACGTLFGPTGRNDLSGWASRRYCSVTCSRSGDARRKRSPATVTAPLAHLRPRDGWQERARCDGVDLSEFYGREGHTGAAIHADASDVANTWCRPCPVQRECLLYALATEERWGLWGGMTPKERDELAARMVRAKASA